MQCFSALSDDPAHTRAAAAAAAKTTTTTTRARQADPQEIKSHPYFAAHVLLLKGRQEERRRATQAEPACKLAEVKGLKSHVEARPSLESGTGAVRRWASFQRQRGHCAATWHLVSCGSRTESTVPHNTALMPELRGIRKEGEKASQPGHIVSDDPLIRKYPTDRREIRKRRRALH